MPHIYVKILPYMVIFPYTDLNSAVIQTGRKNSMLMTCPLINCKGTVLNI